MASEAQEKTTFTYEQVSAWREQLFNQRSLRISVEELSKWPLDRYLLAAVFQAAYLDTLRKPTEHEWQTAGTAKRQFAMGISRS